MAERERIDGCRRIVLTAKPLSPKYLYRKRGGERDGEREEGGGEMERERESFVIKCK